MHSIHLKDDDGKSWNIHYNGDWSGGVIVERVEGQKVLETHTIPGKIILEASRSAVAEELINLIEDKFL